MNTLFFLLGKCGRIKNFFEEMYITFTSCKKPILSELIELNNFSFVRESFTSLWEIMESKIFINSDFMIHDGGNASIMPQFPI